MENNFNFNAVSTRIHHLMQQGEELILALNQKPFQLINHCLSLYLELENEITKLYNLVRNSYSLQFPELESIVNHPIDYIRVVQKMGRELDITQVDLQGLLPSTVIMVLSVVASMTSGTPLPDRDINVIIHACDQALALDSTKRKILELMETKADCVAPNLCAVVGSVVASKLMAIVGGITELANLPACNIMLLGAKIDNPAGFSIDTLFRVGYIKESQVFKTTPPSLRKKLCKLLSDKSALAARVDSVNGDPSGNTGRAFREAIHETIDKLQELPPARQPKPLPVPDFGRGNRKKRGGRRLRKMKERYAMTDLRKKANRIQFGVPENSSLGDGFGEGYGMLGQS